MLPQNVHGENSRALFRRALMVWQCLNIMVPQSQPTQAKQADEQAALQMGGSMTRLIWGQCLDDYIQNSGSSISETGRRVTCELSWPFAEQHSIVIQSMIVRIQLASVCNKGHQLRGISGAQPGGLGWLTCHSFIIWMPRRWGLFINVSMWHQVRSLGQQALNKLVLKE